LIDDHILQARIVPSALPRGTGLEVDVGKQEHWSEYQKQRLSASWVSAHSHHRAREDAGNGGHFESGTAERPTDGAQGAVELAVIGRAVGINEPLGRISVVSLEPGFQKRHSEKTPLLSPQAGH